MATSTLTHTILVNSVFGDRKVVVDLVTFSDDYVSGGFAVAASTFGMTFLDAVVPVIASVGASGVSYIPGWDYTNGKLTLWGTNNDSDTNELDPLTTEDIQNTKVLLFVIGK